MTEATAALKRMVWLFPDRESTRTNAKWDAAFWTAYTEVAKELDMTFERVAPEAVTIDALDLHDPKVYIDGVRVTPEDTLFLSSLYSLPYQSADVLNQFTLYAVLEQAGFYLPHPTELAAVCNDKLATLLMMRDCPVPPIPTVRITPGRDLVYDEFDQAVKDLPYPAFSKPASWCSARGINIARDVQDVRGLLSLAHGGDTTMVFQPDLGRRTREYRVFLVDGEPVAVMLRLSGEGAFYPQYSTGGKVAWGELPDELREAVAFFAEKMPVPYVTADFLHDGERFWFGEFELDGGITCPDASDPEAVRIQRDVIAKRFLAYRRGHAAWIGGER